MKPAAGPARHASVWFATVLIAICVYGKGSNAQNNQPNQVSTVSAMPATAYSSAVATEWFQLALQITQQTPGFSPPVAARALGYMGLTLYESIAPGTPGHISLAGQLNELSSLPMAQPDEPLHWPTVANASLATMTRMMFPTATAENKGRIDLLERVTFYIAITYPHAEVGIRIHL